MVFPYFLQLKSEVGIKEFMIWARISWQSCFCWLYSSSPSLTPSNIINLILVLSIWWCPCLESSLVLLKRMFVMTIAFLWQNSVSLCPTLLCTPWPICLWFQLSLDFLRLPSSPLWWKGHQQTRWKNKIHVLIFSCVNSKVATSCCTTMVRMLDSTKRKKKDTSISRAKEKPQ